MSVTRLGLMGHTLTLYSQGKIALRSLGPIMVIGPRWCLGPVYGERGAWMREIMGLDGPRHC